MRRQPSVATASGYFDGAQPDAMDRQIRHQTDAFEQSTVALARRGLVGLAAFDPAAMSNARRVSAELIRWQLQMIVEGERHAGTQFPLDQCRGTNVNRLNLMTVIDPLGTFRFEIGRCCFL